MRGNIRALKRDKAGTEELNDKLWTKLTDNKVLVGELQQEVVDKTRLAERAKRAKAQFSAEKTANADVYANVVSRLSDRDQQLQEVSYDLRQWMFTFSGPPLPAPCRATRSRDILSAPTLELARVPQQQSLRHNYLFLIVCPLPPCPDPQPGT